MVNTASRDDKTSQEESQWTPPDHLRSVHPQCISGGQKRKELEGASQAHECAEEVQITA